MALTAQDVKALRARTGWTTYRLADEVGCNQSTIWRIENEALTPRGAIGKALERLVEANPDEADA